jgi:hypothetical protein
MSLAPQMRPKGFADMKKISFAIVGAASLALAACGGQGDDSLGENVQENMESQADNLDALAADAANQAEAEALGNQAEQLRDEGERAEERVDDADVNAADPAEEEPPVGM